MKFTRCPREPKGYIPHEHEVDRAALWKDFQYLGVFVRNVRGLSHVLMEVF